MCKKSNDYLTFDFYLFFLAQSNYYHYLCNTKENINLNIHPLLIYNIMIIKHLQGGDRLLLPPSMQCVARLAIPAILFAMTVCLSSCATARQGDEIKVHNKVGDRVQL